MGRYTKNVECLAQSKHLRSRSCRYLKLDILCITRRAWVLVATVRFGRSSAGPHRRYGLSPLWELAWGDLKVIHGVSLFGWSWVKSRASCRAWQARANAKRGWPLLWELLTLHRLSTAWGFWFPWELDGSLQSRVKIRVPVACCLCSHWATSISMLIPPLCPPLGLPLTFFLFIDCLEIWLFYAMETSISLLYPVLKSRQNKPDA